MTPDERLMWTLNNHATSDFYVGHNIPTNKLRNATAYFPVPRDATVLGLIDCTVFGSCENGLAITDQGLFWKNDDSFGLTTYSSKNHLPWDELIENQHKIAIRDYDILFGNGSVFSTAGSSVSPSQAYHLFHALAELIAELLLQGMMEQVNESLSEFEVLGDEIKQLEKRCDDIIASASDNDFSDADKICYRDTLITSLALMTAADGSIDGEEIELVSDFINEEELIEDKYEALSEYETLIEKLITSLSKSPALFKLQTEKMLAKAKNLKNRELIDRLKIMLEGMGEAVGGSENVATFEVMQKIMKSLK